METNKKEKIIKELKKIQEEKQFNYSYELADFIVQHNHKIWNETFSIGYSISQLADKVFN